MSNHKPWQQQTALTEDEVRHIVQTNFPQLAVETVSALGNGWDNTTWLINQDWVFRMPKHAQAATLLKSEINILPHLPKFGVNYPKPQFISLSPKAFPYPFYGHRYLQGTSADHAKLTLAERTTLAGELGTFLKQLHAFPRDQAKALSIGFDQIGRADVKKRFALAQERLHYLMQHGLINNVSLWLNAFEANLSMTVPDEWVLGHGDFYARHILLDEHKHLTAVIDWGDCELLSPAVDLAIVYQLLPLSAHGLFWDTYGEVSSTIQTLAMLRAIYSSATIAWYARQVQDASLLTEGLLGLKFICEAIDSPLS